MILSYDNAECKAVAAELLRRRVRFEPDASFKSGVREFLVKSVLVGLSDIREQVIPSKGSSNSVAMTVLFTRTTPYWYSQS